MDIISLYPASLVKNGLSCRGKPRWIRTSPTSNGMGPSDRDSSVSHRVFLPAGARQQVLRRPSIKDDPNKPSPPKLRMHGGSMHMNMYFASWIPIHKHHGIRAYVEANTSTIPPLAKLGQKSKVKRPHVAPPRSPEKNGVAWSLGANDCNPLQESCCINRAFCFPASVGVDWTFTGLRWCTEGVQKPKPWKVKH